MLRTQLQPALLRRCFATSARASNFGDLPLPNAKGTFDKPSKPASNSGSDKSSSAKQSSASPSSSSDRPPQSSSSPRAPPNQGARPSGPPRRRTLSPSVLRTSTPRTTAQTQNKARPAPRPTTDWAQPHLHIKVHAFIPPGVPAPVPVAPPGADDKPAVRKPLRVARRTRIAHAPPKGQAGFIIGPLPRRPPPLSEADEKKAREAQILASVGGEAEQWSTDALLKDDKEKAHVVNAAQELSRNAGLAPEGRKWLVDKIRELAP